MKFPKMPECTNCGDCCGPTTARPSEARKIREFTERRGIEWIPDQSDPLKCGFYQRGLCAIYPVRPDACRMFGVVKEMPCSYFPQAARVSFPPKAAFASGVFALDNKLLAEEFAPDGGELQRGAQRVMLLTMMEQAEEGDLHRFENGLAYTPMMLERMEVQINEEELRAIGRATTMEELRALKAIVRQALGKE